MAQFRGEIGRSGNWLRQSTCKTLNMMLPLRYTLVATDCQLPDKLFLDPLEPPRSLIPTTIFDFKSWKILPLSVRTWVSWPSFQCRWRFARPVVILRFWSNCYRFSLKMINLIPKRGKSSKLSLTLSGSGNRPAPPRATGYCHQVPTSEQNFSRGVQTSDTRRIGPERYFTIVSLINLV